MFTATAVRAPIYLEGLFIPFLLPRFRTDVVQLPPVMADIIMSVFVDLSRHVVIFADVFCVGPGFPLFMVLELDITGDPLPFQIQQVFFAAVAAVRRDGFRETPGGVLVFFQHRNQCVHHDGVVAGSSLSRITGGQARKLNILQNFLRVKTGERWIFLAIFFLFYGAKGSQKPAWAAGSSCSWLSISRLPLFYYLTFIDTVLVAFLYFDVCKAVILILYVPFLIPFFKVTFPDLLTVIFLPLVTL